MATGGHVDVQLSVRVSDITKEPQKMLMPIRGYEKMPLVSLEEAVAPLVSILPEVQDYVYVAKQRCGPVPANGLTLDQSASIMLYSMEWEPHEECLYFILNATLRTENRRKLVPWFSYLKLILTALERLPSTPQVVYRGVNADLSDLYTKGKTFVWWGFSSCTNSIEVLDNEQLLAKTGERTLFTITCDSGKDISRHSYYQSEKEILLLAARQFMVEACLRPAPGFHMVQLNETQPPITLLKPATNKSDPIKPSSSENQQFAALSTHNKLYCRGRPCASCGKCRDWCFNGDSSTWNWIRDWKNWGKDDRKRYKNDRIYLRFKHRDGSKCDSHALHALGYAAYGDAGCLCENNFHD